MIFADLLNPKMETLSKEMDRLLDYGLKKQSHPGNLLLFHVNGFYSEDNVNWNKTHEQKFNPHVIGPGLEGHSESVHHDFIHKYRTTHVSTLTYKEYLEEIKWTQEKSKKIDEIVDFEETTIQLEMLIYLKFWEADMIIKKLYQLVRILNGENYDWCFKVANSARDVGATGSRQDIIRLKIRDRLKDISPTLYNLIKDSYKTQLRNCIAHSTYSFLNRTIGLNNYIKEDQASQLKGISFEDWIDIFHNTLVLHNEYIRINNVINDHYGRFALETKSLMPILITDQNAKQYELLLEYREQFGDWHFASPKV